MQIDLVGISQPRLNYCRPHTHDQWEIVMCLEGQCELTIASHTLTLQPGTFVCQPPHVPHSTRSEAGYQDLFMRVSGFVPPTRGDWLLFQDHENHWFRNLMLMAHETCVGTASNRGQLLAALAEAMYQLLCTWSASQKQPTAVETVIREMIRHLADDSWSLSHCLLQTGYSLGHMRRCFQKETGLSPQAYFTQLRIDQARRLLALEQHGGYTIKQIALMCGFQDPYYFSRTFKKLTGFSPSNYAP